MKSIAQEDLMDHEYVYFQMIYLTQLGHLLSLIMVSRGLLRKESIIKVY